MANLCDFSMCVRGKHDDIEKFYDAMSQNGSIYMGRGADASIEYDDDEQIAFINGYCKWSVQAALVDNALSMRHDPSGWSFGDKNPDDLEFITLWEACKKWDIVMEVYSEEPGCEFQEHFICDKGDILCDECADWCEYDIYGYETKEEAEQDLGITITDEEWEDGNDYVQRGGFEDWTFDI